MVRLEQVWRERISWLQSSGLTVVDQAAGLNHSLPAFGHSPSKGGMDAPDADAFRLTGSPGSASVN
jgi:hypothetical protein